MPDLGYRIDRSEVLRYLGHRGQEIDRELDALIDRVCEECLNSAEPRYFWQVFELEERDGQPALAGTGAVFQGKDIKKHLNGAKYCAVMAATLGFEVERAMMRLSRRSTTGEIVFNAACTALIEAVSDRCESEILDWGRARSLTGVFRYSPGYGDFPLEQQPEVLNVISADVRLGITLTDSMLMLPKKSVSALIGLFPEGVREARHGTSCDTCENRENCEYRRGGTSCGK